MAVWHIVRGECIQAYTLPLTDIIGALTGVTCAQVLYDSLMGDPYICHRIPPRLLETLEFHKTLIFYDDEEEMYYDDDAEQQVTDCDSLVLSSMRRACLVLATNQISFSTHLNAAEFADASWAQQKQAFPSMLPFNLCSNPCDSC